MLADEAAHSEQERARQLIHELGFSENNNSDEAPIRAPIAGVVLDTGTAVGEWQRSLDNATPLATIANLDHVWVLGDAYQSDLASIRVGRPVTVNFPAYPGLSLSGKVDNLSQSLDPSTLAVKVRVVLANPQMKLKPQMFANILVDRSSMQGISRSFRCGDPRGQLRFGLRSDLSRQLRTASRQSRPDAAAERRRS